MLATDLEAPVVAETTVGAHLLEGLEVITQLGGQSVRVDLGGLAILPVLATVKEPLGHLTLEGVLQDGHEAVGLILGHLTGTLVHVDASLLAHQASHTAPDTSDGGQCVSDLLLTVQVRVQHTQHEGESGGGNESGLRK